jgi:hypothetical protein
MNRQREDEDNQRKRRLRKACVAIGTVTLLIVANVVSWKLTGVGHMAFVAAAVVSLLPVANRTMAAVDSGTPLCIETFVTLAAVAMISIGASLEAAVLLSLFATADWLTEWSASLNARVSRRGQG